MSELPPQIQNMVAQLQQLQQQLQTVLAQKAQIEALLKEAEESMKEVENISEETPLFKVAGSVLVKVEKGKLVKELQEKRETYEIRVKALERQEEKLKDRLAEMQRKIQTLLTPKAG
jgi:prefoldin beta subunit